MIAIGQPSEPEPLPTALADAIKPSTQPSSDVENHAYVPPFSGLDDIKERPFRLLRARRVVFA